MSRPSFVIGIAAAALVVATAAPAPVSAQRLDKLTFLTFSGPVQIPGMTLGAGTYRFRLADPESGRKVIQVVSVDGNYIYTMVHTTPAYRSNVTEESTVTFMEAPAGVAPPVKALFYGGERDGYGFLYGKGEPNLTPPPVHPQPEIILTPNPEAAPYVAAAAPKAPEPVPEPVVSGTPEPSAVTEPEPAAPALPATASPVPLMALGGLVSLVVGLGAGLLRRRA